MPPPDDAPHDAASEPLSPPPTGEDADDGGGPASEHDAAAADDSRRVGARYGLPGRFEQSDLEAEVVGDIFDTNEIFTRIAANADREFGHSTQLLFWSGLAAGLAISLSFLGMATVEGALGTSPAARITAALLYPLGFIFTVLGRYQLFTENTLTPVTLVLTWRASIPRLMRIWGLVLGANVLGTAFAGFYFSQTDILSGPAAEAGIEIGRHLLEMDWWTLFFKGTIAGWLVAGMVWLNHAARTATARLFIVFALMFTVAAADLAHCIVGSSEVLYLVFEGEATVLDYFWRFLAPAALGNTVGGVVLVALLNYAQTGGEVRAGLQRLSWREWLLGTAPHEPAA
jgi:formate/nitrite transporter FocA (FNT family)